MSDTSISFQIITHKGEVIVVISTPVVTLSFNPAQARDFAANLLKLADLLDAPASKPN